MVNLFKDVGFVFEVVLQVLGQIDVSEFEDVFQVIGVFEVQVIGENKVVGVFVDYFDVVIIELVELGGVQCYLVFEFFGVIMIEQVNRLFFWYVELLNLCCLCYDDLLVYVQQY